MKDFISWNEEMAIKYNPQRYYETANIIIRYVENKRIRFVKKMLMASEGEMVLEVGCGAGNILEKIEGRLIGVDISERMIACAQQRLRKKDVLLIRANAERLPFCANSFNKIIASELLEHTENPDVVLKEIKRVLAPGGLIVVTIPNEPFINRIKKVLNKIGILNLWFKGVPKRMDEEWHLHSFHLKMLKEIMPQDFMVKKVKAIPFWFFPLRFCVLFSA